MTTPAPVVRPSTVAGWYLYVTLADQNERLPAASAEMDATGDWRGSRLIAVAALRALARRRFGVDAPVPELTAFVVRGRDRCAPGGFDGYTVHDAESLLREALGEKVCVDEMPKKFLYRLFLLVNLVAELSATGDDLARIVVRAEKMFTEAGHSFALVEDSSLR